jgi:4-hydroxyphenylacetate 3-monooxygenase
MIDRNKRLGEQEPYRTAGVVRETGDGIVVRGAKIVGTLAPFCDENLCLATGLNFLVEDEKQYAIAFAHPVNAPGVRWICRDALDPERPHFDRPVAGRLDEMDSVCVYDDVFIPWEKVFVYQDLQVNNGLLPGMRFTESLGHQVIIKNVAKTRFLFGLAHLLAETVQINSFINVQEKLGEILVYLWNFESLAIAAVEGAYQAENGLWYANPAAINAGLRLYPEYYPRIMHIIQQLGASGYIATPQEATLEALGKAIDRYFSGANKDAKGRVQLFRLAWDFVGDS